jgi:hypothetical protein
MKNKLLCNRSNPTGKGGFGARPQDRYHIGEPGFPCCGATTKRAGTPCKNPPSRGKKRCFLHGADAGPGPRKLPRTLRQSHNQTMRIVREAAKAQLAATELHTETMRAFRLYAAEIYEPNEASFLLALDARMKGEAAPSDLREALKMARERR